MLIQTIPLSELHPAPYNPRLTLQPGDKRWKKLERSLAEFELVQPIIWNRRTGHIVGGHQRCSVLKYQGQKEVECVVVDLPLAREKALNIALNNSEVGGDWEAAKLMELLEDLAETPDIDPTLTGFDEHQLRSLQFDPATRDDDPCDRPESHDVIATMEIPYARWAAIHDWIDRLLGEEPTVRLHVRLPGES